MLAMTLVVVASLTAAVLVAVFYPREGGKVPGKWYSPEQVVAGAAVYQENCLSCHGVAGVGADGDWRKPLADGSYPPPPLNGTAHTWHHPLSALLYTVQNGSVARGGKMPAFANDLTMSEQRAVIAYVQSLWDERIYAQWKRRGGER